MGRFLTKAEKKKRRTIIAAIVGGVILALAVGAILFAVLYRPANIGAFAEKAAALADKVITAELKNEIGDAPAGKAGYAVFFSVCDKTKRANVYTGTGKSLESAWDAARKATENGLKTTAVDPLWVKADVVLESKTITNEQLVKDVRASRHEFYRYGLSFTDGFETALLESELNGAKIYEYDKGGIDLEYLNKYLKKSGRKQLGELPGEYLLFNCRGWFCDEDGAICELFDEGLDYGRRDPGLVDADYAKDLLESASAFLVDQVKENGSFVYGMYPRFDNDINNYNILRHATTIWSLILRYRMHEDPALQELIERTIDYMLTAVRYKDDNTAYLYEEKAKEFKLGGCGVSVIAMTEYMDVFGNKKYEDVCKALGGGILSMMDQANGSYVHVLNEDYSLKEEYRTVYYDGEATFALSRLYALTGEQKWLDAAKKAADRFISEGYEKHRDHWVAYAMNEITKHVADRPDYFEFGLRNAQVNLKAIAERDTTYHTYLELLMVTFELYDRMVGSGTTPDKEVFDIDEFLETVYIRVNRQLNGFFYPEYAMYMANPQKILGTFMVRHDGYRIRIDDVQHNIDGYFLYWKNYDNLVKYGLLDHTDLKNMKIDGSGGEEEAEDA